MASPCKPQIAGFWELLLIDFNLIFDEICQDKEVYYMQEECMKPFSLFATSLNAEYTQFALQLMDLWDDECLITMRLTLSWDQTQSLKGLKVLRSISGVMGGVWWIATEIYSSTRCRVFCQHLVCFACRSSCFSCCYRPQERLGHLPLGKRFHPQLYPPYGLQSRESRRGWKAEAALTLNSPGRWEKPGVAEIGSLGGRSICRKRERWVGGWDGSCWHGANPWSKGRQQGTQQKRTLLQLNFVHFWYWEWDKNIFILKNARVWNKHQKTTPQNPPHQSVLMMSDTHQEEIRRIKSSIVANL